MSKIIYTTMGAGEDNDMTANKIDKRFTRKKLRRIAKEHNLKKPYKFIKSGFRWIRTYMNNLELQGYYMLKSANGIYIRSKFPLTWKNLYSEYFIEHLIATEGKRDFDRYYKIHYVSNLITGKEII